MKETTETEEHKGDAVLAAGDKAASIRPQKPLPETIARSCACVNAVTYPWLNCYLFPLLSSGILKAGTQTDEHSPNMCLTGHVRHCFGGPGPRQILACSTHNSSLPRRFLKLLKPNSKF